MYYAVHWSYTNCREATTTDYLLLLLLLEGESHPNDEVGTV